MSSVGLEELDTGHYQLIGIVSHKGRTARCLLALACPLDAHPNSRHSVRFASYSVLIASIAICNWGYNHDLQQCLLALTKGDRRTPNDAESRTEGGVDVEGWS